MPWARLVGALRLRVAVNGLGLGVEDAADFFGEVADAAEQRFVFALAGGGVFAAVAGAGFEVGELAVAVGDAQQQLRIEIARQAEGGDFGLPGGEDGVALALGLLEAGLGVGDFAAGLFALGFDRQDVFEFGEVAFGRLHAEDDRAVGHRQFGVDLLLLAFGVGDLLADDFHLALAGVELLGRGVVGEVFEDPGERGAADADERDEAAVLAEGRLGDESPDAEHEGAEDERREQPAEEPERHHLVVEQVVALLFEFDFVLAGLVETLLDGEPLAEAGDEVARLLEVHRQAVRFAADDGRFDLRAEGALALGEQVDVALGLFEPLLGEAQGVDLRLEGFEVAFVEFGEAAGVFDAEGFGEPFLLGGEAGFVAFGFAFEFVLLPLKRLEPIALLAEGVDPLGVADEQFVDAEAFGFVAQLVTLALQHVGLALVLFDVGVDRVEPFDRVGRQRDAAAEVHQLLVELLALAPVRLEADGDFDRAGVVLGFADLRFDGDDLVVEFLDLHRQLRPEAVLLAEAIDFGAEAVALRREADDARRLAFVVQQRVAIGAEFLDDVVEADPVEARGEAVDPLGRLAAGEAAELVDFVEADGEDVGEGRFVDVAERFAQQAVAAGGAVGGGADDAADVFGAAVGDARGAEAKVAFDDAERAARAGRRRAAAGTSCGAPATCRRGRSA